MAQGHVTQIKRQSHQPQKKENLKKKPKTKKEAGSLCIFAKSEQKLKMFFKYWENAARDRIRF